MPACYVIKKERPKGFKFTVQLKDKPVELIEFVNGRYDCPTDEHEKLIDALMTKPQFTQNIQKVDKSAAEAMTKEHMQQAANVALKGGATAESIRQMESTVARQDLNKVAEALESEADLMVTHDIDQTQARTEAQAQAQTKNQKVGFKLGGSTK